VNARLLAFSVLLGVLWSSASLGALGSALSGTVGSGSVWARDTSTGSLAADITLRAFGCTAGRWRDSTSGRRSLGGRLGAGDGSEARESEEGELHLELGLSIKHE